MCCARSERVSGGRLASALRRFGRLRFGKGRTDPGGNVQLVLPETCGPEDAHDVGGVCQAQTAQDFRRPLTEIAGCAGNFPRLALRTRENIDTRADGELVVRV